MTSNNTKKAGDKINNFRLIEPGCILIEYQTENNITISLCISVTMLDIKDCPTIVIEEDMPVMQYRWMIMNLIDLVNLSGELLFIDNEIIEVDSRFPFGKSYVITPTGDIHKIISERQKPKVLTW